MLPDFCATHNMAPYGSLKILMGGERNWEVLMISGEGGIIGAVISAQTAVLMSKVSKPTHTLC